ncbi:MAG: aminoglycoside phosphotransferase family protein [bacterium]|nr:aminoglycoside phosphotransferase family protein [bacterium]
MNPKEVLNKYFIKSAKFSVVEFGTGATNTTYKVTLQKGDSVTLYVLQHMSLFFGLSSMEDIDAITKRIYSKGINTQSVVPTLEGEQFVSDDKSWWRVLTYIPGTIFDSISSGNQAREAGKLVGIVHNGLFDFDYEFKYKLLHYRDTEFFMNELQSILIKNQGSDKFNRLKGLGEKVLFAYKALPKNSDLPKRIIHGDLKISNVVFDQNGENAVALIDWDTLMRGPVALDLGDALRSWCMSGGEDVNMVKFDKEVYDKALEGYFSTANFLTKEEKESIPWGVKLITLELSARFLIDAFNESYFRLDSSKYKSLFEQNKKRAENQFKFFEEYQKLF